MQRILEVAEMRKNDILETFRALLRTNSCNPPGNETGIVAILTKLMEDFGLGDVRVLEKERGRPNLFANLRGGKQGPTLLYFGHTDTKPVAESEKWKANPFSAEIIDGSVYGRGAVDMKSGVTAMVWAACILKEVGVKLRGNLSLVMMADEETGGGEGARWLMQKGEIHADAGLNSEPSGMKKSFDTLCTAVRGIYIFDIVVKGTQMHSSESDIRGGINASLKLARVLDRAPSKLKFRFKPHKLYPQGPTLNLGDFLQGGLHYGVLSGYAVAGNDLRVLPGMSHQEVKEDLEAYLDDLRKEDPQLDVQIRPDNEFFPSGWLPGAEISPDEPIVASALRAAESVLGFRPQIGGFPATDDANDMIPNFPVIPAFGPGLLHLAHGENERLPIKDLFDATKIYALTAVDYLGHG